MRLLTVALIGLLTVGAQVPAFAERMTVIFILADDLGWADVGYHDVDDDVLTPNLDALAARGIQFSNAYVTSPQCVPSRAALMTGKYAQRFGVDLNVFGPLPLDETTIAERIRDQGYGTGMVGKWDLNPQAA